MQNTLNNKKKFFAQYFGQEVLITHERPAYVGGFNIDTCTTEPDYLYLKPLEDLREDDVMVIFGMTHNADYKYKSFKKLEYGFLVEYTGEINGKEMEMNSMIFNYNNNIKGDWFIKIAVGDYLRSRGYALEFAGLSVNEMIEYGWIVLDCKN